MEKHAGWKKRPFVRALASGLGGLAVLMVLLLLSALGVLRVPALQEKAALLGHAALFLAGLAAACAAAGVQKEARPAAVGTSLAILLLFLLLTALASEHASPLSLDMLWSLLCLASAGLCALLARKPRRGGRRRRR